jgi:hypothetical protein
MLAAALAMSCAPVLAENPNAYCENASEVSSIANQVPDFRLSWTLTTPASLASSLRFDPTRLLANAHGLPACIALLVSASGDVLDAAAYYPKPASLSDKERSYLLTLKFSPARDGDAPVNSIFAMQAEMK